MHEASKDLVTFCIRAGFEDLQFVTCVQCIIKRARVHLLENDRGVGVGYVFQRIGGLGRAVMEWAASIWRFIIPKCSVCSETCHTQNTGWM